MVMTAAYGADMGNGEWFLTYDVPAGGRAWSRAIFPGAQ